MNPTRRFDGSPVIFLCYKISATLALVNVRINPRHSIIKWQFAALIFFYLLTNHCYGILWFDITNNQLMIRIRAWSWPLDSYDWITIIVIGLYYIHCFTFNCSTGSIKCWACYLSACIPTNRRSNFPASLTKCSTACIYWVLQVNSLAPPPYFLLPTHNPQLFLFNQ